MTYTKQEAFDTVAKHLFEQGERSMRGLRKTCAYRSGTGLKCAIGALIPDEMYNPKMDQPNGMDVDELTAAFPQVTELFDSFGVPYENMLRDLQDIHDGDVAWAHTHCMRALLQDVAEDYCLSPSILKTLSFKDR